MSAAAPPKKSSPSAAVASSPATGSSSSGGGDGGGGGGEGGGGLEAAAADVRLIFANCTLYTPLTSDPYHVKAVYLLALFEENYAKLISSSTLLREKKSPLHRIILKLSSLTLIYVI